MIRMLVVLTAGLGVMLAYAPPSEACGIKLTVQSPNVQKQSKRSANPSRVLLVGSPPRQLARNLSNAGHSVEVAQNVDSAQRSSYPIIVADEEHVSDARQRYPDAIVVPRTGSTSRDVASVEQSLQRAPRDASGRRVARRAGGQDREPIAAGGEQQQQDERQPRAAGDEGSGGASGNDQSEREPARAQEETDRSQDEQRQARERNQQRQPEQDENRDREQVAVRDDTRRDRDRDGAARRDHRSQEQQPSGGVEAAFAEEIFFATNSARLSQSGRREMRATAEWLKQNPDVTIVLEGHANAVGNENYNMRLSQRRAETTRDFLVSQGVDASRIEVEWYGQDRPAYGDGIDGRNRRVVLRR